MWIELTYSWDGRGLSLPFERPDDEMYRNVMHE